MKNKVEQMGISVLVSQKKTKKKRRNVHFEFLHLACAAGQYRSASNSSCTVCPANSTSTEASDYCSCIDGHFRANTNEGIGVKCTGKIDESYTYQWRKNRGGAGGEQKE